MLHTKKIQECDLQTRWSVCCRNSGNLQKYEQRCSLKSHEGARWDLSHWPQAVGVWVKADEMDKSGGLQESFRLRRTPWGVMNVCKQSEETRSWAVSTSPASQQELHDNDNVPAQVLLWHTSDFKKCMMLSDTTPRGEAANDRFRITSSGKTCNQKLRLLSLRGESRLNWSWADRRVWDETTTKWDKRFPEREEKLLLGGLKGQETLI